MQRSHQIAIVVFLSLFAGLQSGLLSAGNYEHVDRYVLSLEKSDADDLLRLTHKLVSPFKEPKEKVRAIYRWITENIEYDIQAYMRRDHRAIQVEEILRTRRSMCGGYSALFKQIAETAGLEAEIITGYSKGYGYEIGSLFVERNRHAWNAVKISDQWYLLDATWGAGYIDDRNRFVRHFNEFYFLPAPEELIQSHYPNDPRWQLLETKKTKAEFEESVYVKAPFFYYGLKTLDHHQYQISADGSLRTRIYAPEDVQLVAQLRAETTELDQSLTFTQRLGEIVEINAVFPWTHKYILRIFAKRQNDSDLYEWVMDYNVDAAKSHSRVVGFPEKYSSFEDYKAYLYSPLSRYLKTGSKASFRLKLESAEEIAIIHNNLLIGSLRKTNGVFEGMVSVPKGEFHVAAKFPDSRSFQFLLTFEGRRQ